MCFCFRDFSFILSLKVTSQKLSLKKVKVKGQPTFKMGNLCPMLLFLIMVGLRVIGVVGQVLTPPYFNLAAGRLINASSTCGEDINGGPELYCKLVGATADADANINVIQGQVCDYCTEGSHPAAFAIDGSERWWQSPPLSRGNAYNEVNLTIDLGQEFHVAYVTITMANSPRPGVWVLERSSDNGATYKPWQYFADTPGDCENYFGVDSYQPIRADDSVICDTQYSKVVPLEGGEIFIPLVKNRPSALDFFGSDVLQEWTRATNIRLRLLRTKTLLGHLMSVARQDTTVTRRYYYSIKDISIGGRCRCNGHAETCDITDPKDKYRLLCRCQHNTCGDQCEQCCKGFVQKAWRISTQQAPFACEPCNCFGHSETCYYDEEVDRTRGSIDIAGNEDGGGVCTNCRDNTEGTNCNRCKSGFFRPYGKYWNETDVCQSCRCSTYYHTGNCEEGSGRCECRENFLKPDCNNCSYGYYDFPECKPCDCHINGTRGELCHADGGQCPCKSNFQGLSCRECALGYYNFPQCLPCECNPTGAMSPGCDPVTGQCECINNYGSRQCSSCEDGYYNFPNCQYCNCDMRGTERGICNKDDGMCLCKEGYGGPRCDQCVAGYYGSRAVSTANSNNPECRPCNCSTVGSQTTVCDASGQCVCLDNFSGRTCNQCKAGYYKYPECLSCNCATEGAMGVGCDDSGRCQCKSSFDEIKCTKCKEGYYNYPMCEECNCDPAGVVESFKGCKDNTTNGELCQCKPRVQGRICNECKPLYWNLQHYSPQGCQDCECHVPGILGGVKVCDGKTGQCPCKTYVNSQKCEECADGFFNLTTSNLLGCKECGCDVGGSMHGICEKTNGNCQCRPRVTGQTCTSPLQAHFFPTLYQHQFEAEDGTSRNGGPARFDYDSNLFPNYSWRGYAVYNEQQPETRHDVPIDKSSLYRIVFHYVNPTDSAIVGEIEATPDNPNDAKQRSNVRFEPNTNLVTVSTGPIPSAFYFNPGRWQFTIKISDYLLVDYFVLLPAAYYEASILQKEVTEPCQLEVTYDDETGDANVQFLPNPCLKLEYPSLEGFESTRQDKSFIMRNGEKSRPRKLYTDSKVLEALDFEPSGIVVLSSDQPEIGFDFDVAKNGRYVLLVNYFTPDGDDATAIKVEANSEKGRASGQAILQKCLHATLCREVVTNAAGEVAVFPLSQNSAQLSITGDIDEGDLTAIHSITAIPLRRFVMDYIRPQRYCIFKDGACVASSYDLPPDSHKIEAEADNPSRAVEPHGVRRPAAASSGRSLVRLDPTNRTLEIAGKVPSPGYYQILVHYFQPESPDFTVEIDLFDGELRPGRLGVVHCPSTAGCRSIVAQDDKSTRFYIQRDFTLTLKSPKNVSVDYVLLLPPLYDDEKELSKYMRENPVDETRKFIAECGKNHMYLPPDTTGFCRDSVFSLTTDYNNGALHCECVPAGSSSFECAAFGGQCSCKQNIIGRRCERCKTGFYGFPDCKPCNCPSTAYCEPTFGKCICPERVIDDIEAGTKCSKCAPQSFGYHAINGCEDCACNPIGTEKGNAQCHLLTGMCSCKENVVGQRCDKCRDGYWAFPYCQTCRCDIRGTTAEVCNQDTSACSCKESVEGRGCESCKPGSFNLQETNSQGCSNCFCFGKTQRCSSSSLFWSRILIEKSDWSAVSIDPFQTKEEQVIGHEVEFGLGDAESANEVRPSSQFVPVKIPPEVGAIVGNHSNLLYFQGQLKGNFLASYGGTLRYSVLSNPEDELTEPVFGPDVMIEGDDLPPSTKKIRLYHSAVQQLDGDNRMIMALPLTEASFLVESLTTGLIPATREQVMIVLKNLQYIYIRGAYWKKTVEPKLEDFSLDVGIESRFGDEEERALSVERCQCPSNYRGLSCEECAPGYYRTTAAGPFGGYCIPCDCNEHSETCDPLTGVCSDCKHNTIGDHCEMCEVGFHGNALQGTPHDCLICACPIPTAQNNFGISCELFDRGYQISCVCRPEYTGPRCESCAPGYYGNPELPGDYCKPCMCSGNIDVNDPQSCDTRTGACNKCTNNTGGPLCNLCKKGYFGDALIQKDCKSCSCDTCGTEECDSFSGICNCLPNVEGENCDRCKPEHFGLSRCDGRGCQPCRCGLASDSTECNDATGQCSCKPGVTGKQCDSCAPGFWNYTSEGCQPCLCNQEYAIGVGCNPHDGQCVCLPGVIGANCSHCPHRWVLIKDRGCKPCDSCQYQLLDDTDRLAYILDPVKKEFDEAAVSYFTTQRLVYFNETAEMLEPAVLLLNPSTENLTPYEDAVTAMETDSKTLRQKAEVSNESLKEKSASAAKLKMKSAEVESKVQEAVAMATTAVFETKDLVEGLGTKEKQSSPQTEAALGEARAILEVMKRAKFNGNDSATENATATALHKQVKEFIQPIEELTGELKRETDTIGGIRDKLRDVRNQSDYSLTTSAKANEIINKIKDVKFPAKIAILKGLSEDMAGRAGNASLLNEKSAERVEQLKKSYNDIENVSAKVKAQTAPLEQTSETLRNELENNRDTIRNSNEHVRNLKYQADRLDEDFDRSRSASEHAVAAATAYQKITDALQEANEKALETKESSDNATIMTNGIGESSARAMEPSRNLLVTADQAVRQVDNDLKTPLEDAKRRIEEIKGTAEKTKTKADVIADELAKMKIFQAPAKRRRRSDYSDLEKANTVSQTASDKAQAAVESVEPILNKIPEMEARTKSLPITVADLNKGLQVAENQLNEATESIPLSSAITESLEQKRPDFEARKTKLGRDIAELKEKIKSARELANRVPVGMTFQESSNLLVANPQSLEAQQVQTKISLFFKTRDPGGLVLFIGNEPGRKQENDFMAIEIEHGYPLLTVDLGSGSQVYMINEKYVADDKWYKANVERSGRNIQFAVTEEVEGKEVAYVKKDSYSRGTKSLFNLHPNATKIFVGGFPAGQFQNPVRQSNFRGSIEDLTIGDEKVGLWNFRDAQNVSPALGRDTFIDLGPKQGLRFLGNGYAILDRTRFAFVAQSSLRFKFQTRAKNGLLFLVGKGRKFMSLEMANGAVSFKFDLGNGITDITTPEPYNDGHWHTVSAVRFGPSGRLEIDGQNRGQATGPDGSLTVTDYMYFGGYPNQHDFRAVTNRDFEGCLDEVQVENELVDLRSAVEQRDTMAGCPSSPVDLVASFFGDGFLKIDSGVTPSDSTPPISHTRDDVFELTFRFRTNDSQGLIFYGTDAAQENYLSVSMAEGALHIRTMPGESKVNTEKLNDGGWHLVTITRDRNTLSVNVDDAFEYQQNAPSGPLSLSSPGSMLLFGGRPTDFQMKVDSAESEEYYKGCLGDISVNGKQIDFSASEGSGSSVTRNCQSEKEEVPPENSSYAIGRDDDLDEKSTKSPAPAEHQETTTQMPETTTYIPPPPFIQRPATKKPKVPENAVPFEKCRLPFRRQLPLDDDASLDDGVQFGNFDKTSRIEFTEATDDGGRSEYSIEFKTLYPDGVILIKTRVDSTDFISVHLRGGSIHFAFDLGSGQGVINSTKTYNDGVWHTVMVERILAEGTLTVDGELIGKGSSPGSTTNINAGQTLFVGGLSGAMWSKKFNTARKVGSPMGPFNGCLRNLNIRSEHPGQPTLTNAIEPCMELSEPGFAFYPNQGYMKLTDKFKVGRRIKIDLAIKPRSPSGILLAVHGETDYMVLQMVNGTIKFTIDNGKAPLASSFSTQPYDLCDGRWHTIQASKSKNVVTLGIDDTFASPGIGPGGSDATDTDHPLYWGGHPNPAGKPGLETTEQFVGCMRNFVIYGRNAIKYDYEAMQGTVGVHTCQSD